MRMTSLLAFGGLSMLLAACSPASPPPVGGPAAPATAPASESVPASGNPSVAPTEPATGKRSAGQEDDPVLAYRAFGNEPFWSVRIDGETLVFSTPENPDGRTMQGQRVPSLRGVAFHGKDGDVDFNLDIQDGACSDGMSDNQYVLVSTFIYGETTYRGCAEAAK